MLQLRDDLELVILVCLKLLRDCVDLMLQSTNRLLMLKAFPLLFVGLNDLLTKSLLSPTMVLLRLLQLFRTQFKLMLEIKNVCFELHPLLFRKQ